MVGGNPQMFVSAAGCAAVGRPAGGWTSSCRPGNSAARRDIIHRSRATLRLIEAAPPTGFSASPLHQRDPGRQPLGAGDLPSISAASGSPRKPPPPAAIARKREDRASIVQPVDLFHAGPGEAHVRPRVNARRTAAPAAARASAPWSRSAPRAGRAPGGFPRVKKPPPPPPRPPGQRPAPRSSTAATRAPSAVSWLRSAERSARPAWCAAIHAPAPPKQDRAAPCHEDRPFWPLLEPFGRSDDAPPLADPGRSAPGSGLRTIVPRGPRAARQVDIRGRHARGRNLRMATHGSDMQRWHVAAEIRCGHAFDKPAPRWRDQLPGAGRHWVVAAVAGCASEVLRSRARWALNARDPADF